jgi:small subunit ribosomal protein S1
MKDVKGKVIMVMDNIANNKSGGAPPVDDSWWMSILEDVEDRFASDPESQQKQKPAPNGRSVKAVRKASPEASDELDWEWAEQLYGQDQVVDLEVTGYNRGGILVACERLQGFVPVSHLIQVSRKCDDKDGLQIALEAYVGKSLPLKVIECDRERGRIVFSERAAQTDSGRRIQLLDDLNEGDCVHGTVTTITDFGAFVDLGGIEGLIHISELSWGRVQHPEDIVSDGQQVQVCVIQIDRQRSRVALSLKRLLPNPWDTVEEMYQPGQITEAVITSVVSFGAFARLETGLDGLIHASELGSNGNGGKRPDEVLRKGQRVQVRILNIDPARQRLGLSLQSIDA